MNSNRFKLHLNLIFPNATIILKGNIRDILGTAMKNKNEFRTRQSAINSYMVKYKVHIVILLSLCNNTTVPGAEGCAGQSEAVDGVLVAAAAELRRE